MQDNLIKIRGARVHNLKNINVDIPKNKLVVITGLSGSGKSSLAFDTLYAEGQRRYVESLSAYARQFLGVMDKPDVDKIEGISPAISIDQRKGTSNPRSTVGTITEIYDYLRLLFARIGKPHCPKCGKIISRQTIDQVTEQVLSLPKNTEIAILGPVIRAKKGEHHGTLEEIHRAGFVRVRIDGIIYLVEEVLEMILDKKKKHNIEVVVDRLVIPARNASYSDEDGDEELDKSRLVDSLETGLKLGKGIVMISQNQKGKPEDIKDLIFSQHFACEECGISVPELEPRLFSFNAPFGSCASCQGIGIKLVVDPDLVMPNKNLTLAEGAILPWSRASHKVGRQGFFWWKLSELAQKYKFSVDDPVKELPKSALDLILYGEKSGAKLVEDEKAFEGVIPWLERRYHETDSEWAREEIGQYMVEKLCEGCKGKRLRAEVLAITIMEKSIDDVVTMSIDEAQDFFNGLIGENKKTKLKAEDFKIGEAIVKEIINRLQFLLDVGLDYLTLSRRADTLSGGEEQRIRLATQIGSKLTGVLYILDEPSIGLHARDQHRLIETLEKLRDIGNSVIVVEHDPQTILAADWIIDVGPGAGKHGGHIIFEGTSKALLKAKTLTGDYLSGRRRVEMKKIKDSSKEKNNTEQKYLTIHGATEHNLKNITVKIPLGKFVCITGVSGSGKSTLMNDILAKELLKKFYNAKEEPGKYESTSGIEYLNKVVLVDQSPIGRTPRSNPATYTGAFSYIRDLFAQTKEARIRGYGPGRFSFNVRGGRCEACEGQGIKKIEMYFLPDIYVECEECKGQRFNKETLVITYKDKNISEILNMTVEEALEFFKHIPPLHAKMKTLNDVGLGYVQLGQPAPSLSGGEAQRVKLATELSKKSTGKTLYVLDEPTTGLHMDDVNKMLYVLKELVNKGNSVFIIEHNLDVIRNADWVIDLGPDGGDKGGYIVAEGAPKDIAKNKKSWTGKYLSKAL